MRLIDLKKKVPIIEQVAVWEGFMDTVTIIVGLCFLFLVIASFLFKSQFFILLNRLANIEFRHTKNSQDADQGLNTELPTLFLPALTKEKIATRIMIFAVLSCLIYIALTFASRILIELGNTEFSAGNEKLGTASYTLALEFDDNLKKAMSQCLVDNAQKQYKLAIDHCSNATKINGNYAYAYFSRGYAYMKLGQYDQAIADFTKHIEIIPIATSSYINRGTIYMKQNQYDLAIADFTKSIGINPQETQSWLDRGLSHYQQGHNDLAISDCNKAAELNDKNWSAYFCLGSAFTAQEKYDLAITNFDKAIKNDPSQSVSYFSRGSVYDIQEKQDLAISDYTKAIELDPNFGIAYSSRGIIYAKQSKYDLAISDFSKAIENDHNNLDAYVWRGNAFADTKQFDLAIADYQKALTISGESKQSSYIYCVQGITYTKMGDFELAIASLQQGVALDSNDENNWCKSALENARKGIPTQ